MQSPSAPLITPKPHGRGAADHKVWIPCCIFYATTTKLARPAKRRRAAAARPAAQAAAGAAAMLSCGRTTITLSSLASITCPGLAPLNFRT